MKKWIIVLLVFGAVVAAYGDTLSLTIRWDDFIANGTAQSVALHRNRTIAGVLNESQTEVSIRGYNTATGNLVWTDTFPAESVLVKAAQVYAIVVSSVGATVFIRSYDLHSGTIRWTNTSETLSSLNGMLIRNGKLVIVGYDPAFVPQHGVILVFDASTGVLLWKTAIDIPPVFSNETGTGNQTTLWDVDDAGRNIVVVGALHHGPGEVRDLLIRSYRLRDGELRWEVLEPHAF